ncbi:aspartyl/asparaginyl beta-hydroxylase domain-containing protein [Oscillatoria salina]|uniref:aspartyl/asparaginyl beta-hydroxylase domain-containing protein n=1 Tax=Oscillatoria salina TaxID=331517 RepID=UPI001CCFF3D9|nr:aspartyl/asparaginyl beta-hydroxylase domain-containing protein [Oscillatoria salina]MBZ8180642.1 aspartyl/asparaginyl beta-hydroxylase domain-containing protein [Oscillatoria salina IIICB1]
MTILTLDDNLLTQYLQAALHSNAADLPPIACLGPTYVAQRRGGQYQQAQWCYGLDLGATLSAVVEAIAPSASRPAPDTLEVCFTHRYRRVTAQQFQQVFANVHRGIRGIELQYRDRMVRYAPTTLVARNLTFQKVLANFLQDLNLTERTFFKQGVVQAFDARQVVMTLHPIVKAETLHRGSCLVPLAALSGDVLQQMTTLMGEWLLRQVQADGRLTYKYFPSRGTESGSNNLIRQFMATLAMVRYARQTGRSDRQVLATHNLTYNLAQFYRTEGELGFVAYNGKVKLGAIALAALTILEHADLTEVSLNHSPFASQFAGLCRTVEHLWQPDGSFRTFLQPSDRNDNQNFYPGEALLFWAAMYKRTPDPQLLERCRLSIAYYRTWHQQQRNPAFVPWHTQAYALLYQATGDRDLLDLIFEMNDWLLAMQQWDSARYDDLRGRFYNPDRPKYGPPHASSTGVYLEGLVDAYQLAVQTDDRDRAQCYQSAIWRGLRSVRQLQFYEAAEMYYVSQRSPVYGAIRTTVYNNVIRVDNVQHCLMALLKLTALPEFWQGHPPVTTPSTETFSVPLPIATASEVDSLQHFRLLDTEVNIQPLVDEIAAHSDLWLHDTSRQTKVKVQRETHTIYLRSAVKPFPPGVSGNDVHPSRRTQLAQHFPRTMEWLESFARKIGGELGRATIVRLAPKGRVYRHIDKGEYYRIRDRYHLVLQSTAGSLLGAGDEWVRMQPGECWWFDNKAPHEAYNESDDWRIHLIFDILPQSSKDCISNGK